MIEHLLCFFAFSSFFRLFRLSAFFRLSLSCASPACPSDFPDGFSWQQPTLDETVLIQSRQFRHQYLVWTNNLQVSNWLHHSSSYEVTLVSPLSQNKRNLFIENSPHWLKQHIFYPCCCTSLFGYLLATKLEAWAISSVYMYMILAYDIVLYRCCY